MHKSLRLGNIAKEFNIHHKTLINFLASKGLSIENNLTQKLSEEAYILIQAEFNDDKLENEKRIIISFKIPERPYYKNKFEHRICFSCNNCTKMADDVITNFDLILQPNVVFRIWLFEKYFKCNYCGEEINLHYEIIEAANEKVTESIVLDGASLCECPNGDIAGEDEDKDSNNDYDPYENFHWGGLSGEEAYIGYWNTE